MWKLLHLLIFGTYCDHTDEEVGRCDVYESDRSARPITTKYVLRCTKCGRMKSYEI